MMGGFLSMVTAPPAPPTPNTVAPGTGSAPSSAPPLPPSQTISGPVNARQQASVGAQEIALSYSNTDFGGIGAAVAILALLAFVALLIWWLL